MPSASRVGRKPVVIPAGVDVKIHEQTIAIKGPKGHLTLAINPFVEITIDKNDIKISTNPNRGYCRTGSGARLLDAIPGTMRAEINNAVHGVTVGFESKLTLKGVGYNAQVKGKVLSLKVGHSHLDEFVAPDGITLEAPTATEIVVKGPDKHRVGHVASMIRGFRPPELYKGKGIRYADETIKLKETKKK